jgi:hypothetical protein
MKKITLILIFLALSAYCAPEINFISPSIDYGFSVSYKMYRNPLFIEYDYKKAAAGDKYVGYASDVYFSQEWVREVFVAGSKDEKNEWGVSYALIPCRLRFRYKYNAFEVGGDNLFQNVSFSLLCGSAMAYYFRNMFDEHVFSQQSNGYIQLFGGLPLGTRKKIIDKFSYIEIFASPQISFTYYGGLGGGEDYNPVGEIHPNWNRKPSSISWKKGARFSKTMWDFAVPIGVGFKYRLFFVKSGIALTTTFGGEERTYRGGELTVDSYNFPRIPFFAECGFNFNFRMFKSKRSEKETRESQI